MSVTREYICKCGVTIVDKVSIADPVKVRCPECGGKLKQNLGSQEHISFGDCRHGVITNRFKASRHG